MPRFRFRRLILRKGVVRCGAVWLAAGVAAFPIPESRVPSPEGRAIAEARFQGAAFDSASRRSDDTGVVACVQQMQLRPPFVHGVSTFKAEVEC
jgi:hypothetical protein